MRKTTITVDDALVQRARQILGTHGLKDTVDRALEEVVAAEARRAFIRRLEAQDGIDLSDPAIRSAAWDE